MSRAMDRRGFFEKSLAGGAAASILLPSSLAARPTGAAPAERLGIGFIGVGARAHDLLAALQRAEAVEVTAVCDAYRGRVERALQVLGGDTKSHPDYRGVLDDPSVDAVFVATPDHLHKRHILAALDAGKDVYSEKPLTYSVDEGLEIIRAAERSGRLVQVGSQGISSTIQRKARELIQEGRLGQVTLIRATWNRNTASGAWIYPIPPDASPDTVEWDAFLGSAPKRPFDLERFFRWRCYRDYAGGIPTDLFVHLCTTIHYLMDAKMPKTVMAAGQLYRWAESRDVPDTVNAILDYPEGFTLNISSTFNNSSSAGAGFQILGTEGTIVLGGNRLELSREQPVEDNAWIVRSWPQALEDAYWKDPEVKRREKPATRRPITYTSREVITSDGLGGTDLHIGRFLDSVRTRKPPEEDADAGHRAAACAHMVNLSAEKGTPVQWDFDQNRLRTAARDLRPELVTT